MRHREREGRVVSTPRGPTRFPVNVRYAPLPEGATGNDGQV